tara:strand:+ start:5153 stop:6301 length:1149 start_codon:yes stop_codon:yes gene_type:complete
MKILVIGGDGFCGWPTSLKLVADGHDITIIDNFSRRALDNEMSSNSLTEIASISKRLDTAKEYFGNINFEFCDVVGDYLRLENIFRKYKPDAVLHLAELKSAPYSMLGERERRSTVDKNITSTHNILNAIVEVDKNIHLVHLGTMGVYGYNKDFGKLPEGYLNVKVNSTEKNIDILYPTNPGSVYHMTKSLDQILFQFYNKNWNLPITDLHQGVVWGVQTDETKMHFNLTNRFDYDGLYGTVLNRFVSQSASGNDITVYGTGGQTRAFIHIEDSVKCIQLAIENRPKTTEKVRIFNQVSEVRNVRELAEIIKSKYGSNINYIDNPRNEASENDLEIENSGLISLGFQPTLLNDTLLDDLDFIAKAFKDKVDNNKILNSPKWN